MWSTSNHQTKYTTWKFPSHKTSTPTSTQKSRQKGGRNRRYRITPRIQRHAPRTTQSIRTPRLQQTYNNKYNSKPCDDSMSFQDCELAILRQAVDENEDKKKQSIANSEEVKKMIEIVEEFLKDTKCICYGGTAINNILPTEAQFYNRDTEIPDYDFYSPKPLDHAKQLADIFLKLDIRM